MDSYEAMEGINPRSLLEEQLEKMGITPEAWEAAQEIATRDLYDALPDSCIEHDGEAVGVHGTPMSIAWMIHCAAEALINEGIHAQRIMEVADTIIFGLTANIALHRVKGGKN